MKMTRLDMPPARTKKMVREQLGALVRLMHGDVPDERLARIVQASVDSGEIEGYAELPEDDPRETGPAYSVRHVMSADDLRAEIKRLERERDARG